MRRLVGGLRRWSLGPRRQDRLPFLDGPCEGSHEGPTRSVVVKPQNAMVLAVSVRAPGTETGPALATAQRTPRDRRADMRHGGHAAPTPRSRIASAWIAGQAFSKSCAHCIISRSQPDPTWRQRMFTLGQRRRSLLRMLAAIVWTVAAPLAAPAQTLQVVTSGGLAAALRTLAPMFERSSGVSLSITSGASMGDTHDAIPNRLARGEPFDLVVMADGALEALVRSGQVQASSKTVLARSPIAMAVRAGAPRPEISSVESLRRTLLDATSVAYSDSASGVYLSTVLFPRLGIAAQMAPKSRKIAAEPVGQVVARGEAQIGFQQLSELRPVPGIDIVGLLPDGAQQLTLFSAGIVSSSAQPEAARRLLDFLVSADAAEAIRSSGLQPVSDPVR